ncbi:hypothetical protein A7K73_06190 [Candidatus Methylacidiphilum fumarolicum]|nr:hypothetical protein A7K73_06190 [Candidatus Methylacidiphilum fumarolicum]TFE76970.1 hypothetical protein A7D33_07105 [Candidatus Methylacidiphilum fumarolicum]
MYLVAARFPPAPCAHEAVVFSSNFVLADASCFSCLSRMLTNQLKMMPFLPLLLMIFRKLREQLPNLLPIFLSAVICKNFRKSSFYPDRFSI